jgi:hypothetical protein
MVTGSSRWPAITRAGPARRHGAEERFWALTSTKRYLPRETREYVPMILAAIIIAKNPELYGFHVTSAPPLAYETVKIPGALDLKFIADWANVTVEQLQDLNPELRRTTTPMTSHALVPIGTAASIEAGLLKADSLYRTFRFHTVKGETVTSVARVTACRPRPCATPTASPTRPACPCARRWRFRSLDHRGAGQRVRAPGVVKRPRPR